MYRSIGEGIGGALQQIGGLIIEDAQWRDRRKTLAEEARAALQEKREYEHDQRLMQDEQRRIEASTKAQTAAEAAALAHTRATERDAAKDAARAQRLATEEEGRNRRKMMRGDTTPARDRYNKIVNMATGRVYEKPVGAELGPDEQFYDSAAAKESRKAQKARGPISEGLGRIASAITGVVKSAPQQQADQPVEIKTDKNGRKWKIYADGTMEPAE